MSRFITSMSSILPPMNSLSGDVCASFRLNLTSSTSASRSSRDINSKRRGDADETLTVCLFEDSRIDQGGCKGVWRGNVLRTRQSDRPKLPGSSACRRTIDPREKGVLSPKHRVMCCFFTSNCADQVPVRRTDRSMSMSSPGAAMGPGANTISRLGTLSRSHLSCTSYCLRSPSEYALFLISPRIVSVTFWFICAAFSETVSNGTKVISTTFKLKIPFPDALKNACVGPAPLDERIECSLEITVLGGLVGTHEWI